MKKTIWIIVILIIVVAAVIWATNSKVEEPGNNEENGEEEMMENGEEATSTEGLGEDEPSDIDEQLEGIDDEGIEGDFEEVDEDLENL